ncbi:MAG TPA: hypothetical protein VND63_06560 [Rhodanobacteraceae bacterium]|nr:hypothetical protein [Rhodanobacteraceae bacterium]
MSSATTRLVLRVLCASLLAVAGSAGAGEDLAHGATQLTIRIDARAAAVIRAVSAGATLQQALAQLPAADSAQAFAQDCASSGGHAAVGPAQRLCT